MLTKLPDDIRVYLTYWGRMPSWWRLASYQQEITKTELLIHEARHPLPRHAIDIEKVEARVTNLQNHLDVLETSYLNFNRQLGLLHALVDQHFPWLLRFWPEIPTCPSEEQANALAKSMREIAGRIFERIDASQTQVVAAESPVVPVFRHREPQEEAQGEPEKKSKGRKPNGERANKILAAIRKAGKALSAKVIFSHVRGNQSTLRANLSWMVYEDKILVKLPHGYWLAAESLPSTSEVA